ncbi:hypothetical protein WDU94_000740, partial [Cyamophila willieti]
ESGYDDILQVGSVVACSNLQYRTNTLAELSTDLTNSTTDLNNSNVELCIPSCYSTEHSVYSRSPRLAHLSQPHAELTANLKTMDLKAYIIQCESVLKSRSQPLAAASTSSRSIVNQSTPTMPYKVSGLSRKRKPSLLDQHQVVAKKLCHNQKAYEPATGMPDRTGTVSSGTTESQLSSRVSDSKNELSSTDSGVKQIKTVSNVVQSVYVTPVTNRLIEAPNTGNPTTNTTSQSVPGKVVSTLDSTSKSNFDSFNMSPNDSFIDTSLVLESSHLSEDLSSVNNSSLKSTSSTLNPAQLLSKSTPGSRPSLLKSHSIVSTSRTNLLDSSTSLTNNVTPRPNAANTSSTSSYISSSVSVSSSNVPESSLNHSCGQPPVDNNSKLSTPNPRLILHKRPNPHLVPAASKSMINLTSNSTSTPKRPNTSTSLLTSTPKGGGNSSFGAQFEKSFELPGEKSVTPIQKKIHVLERYGEPPPLTSGILSLRSKKLLKPFRVPKK